VLWEIFRTHRASIMRPLVWVLRPEGHLGDRPSQGGRVVTSATPRSSLRYGFGAGGLLCGNVFDDPQGIGGPAEVGEHPRQQIAARYGG
jgi:hypothetical protein